MQIEKVPKHIGIIVDGNRRFAKRLMMKPWKGHEWGAKKFEQLLEWCKEYKVKELTLYTFSIENFKLYKGFHKKFVQQTPLFKIFGQSFTMETSSRQNRYFYCLLLSKQFQPLPFPKFHPILLCHKGNNIFAIPPNFFSTKPSNLWNDSQV